MSDHMINNVIPKLEKLYEEGQTKLVAFKNYVNNNKILSLGLFATSFGGIIYLAFQNGLTFNVCKNMFNNLMWGTQKSY